MKTSHQIPVKSYRAGAGFVRDYQNLIRSQGIPYQYDVLCDRIPGVEKSHAIENFRNAADVLRGGTGGDGFYGWVFQDSDVAKWLETVGYALSQHRDEQLERTADEVIALIAQAQDKDGYLDTCFTVSHPERRWTDLLEAHELYCAGHMMEAACAYYDATGKRQLLDVMEKCMEHIYDVFITQGHPGYPGHPEVELALLKLYRVTGNPHCYELAAHFINTRGVDADYYTREIESRDWQVWSRGPVDPLYQQSSCPVRELSSAHGHAVRAVYLYTAMADLASQTGDEALLAACHRLWESITKKQMFITGGIGSTPKGEAFTVDYDLRGDMSYAETCASVGLMFFASRMLEMEPSQKYSDVMELAFYNTVLAGIQLDCKKFFYVNTLESVPGITGVGADHQHIKPLRSDWHSCACCPPNAARLIASFGQYAYGENDTTAFCHLYAAGEVDFGNGLHLTCQTGYPYDFTVKYRVGGSGQLAIRVPGWSRKWTLAKNGTLLEMSTVDGYAYVDVADRDEVVLALDGAPRFLYPSPKIPSLSGRVALMRGPLVYCFEGVDNGDDVLSLRIDPKCTPTVDDADPALGNALPMTMPALRENICDDLYTGEPPVCTPVTARAIPYYTWSNRGLTQMRVWMPKV